MIFKDRHHAGQELANYLIEYKDLKDTIVVALPRGGVVIGYEVSQKLHIPLDIICPRKIGAPFNPEFAIGAITETGESIFNQDIIKELSISSDYIKQMIEVEKKQAERRLILYRKNRPPRNLERRFVILVDDGLATGLTMKAAIKSIKRENPKKIVVAIPVAPSDTLKEIQKEVDEVVCISVPSSFHAVGQFYQNFLATEDEEVIKLMNA